MIGTYNYLLYTNDTAFLHQNWAGYLKAMDFIYAKVGQSGLLNVTGLRDWARWQTGGNGSEPNMMYMSQFLLLPNLLGFLLTKFQPIPNPHHGCRFSDLGGRLHKPNLYMACLRLIPKNSNKHLLLGSALRCI